MTTANHSEPSANFRWVVLLSVCGLGTVAYVHRLVFMAVTSDLKTTFDFNDNQMGYLLGAFLLAYGAFEMPWGRICDRFGARHVLAGITVAWSLATGAVTLALLLPREWGLPFLVLLALRFLFGLFQAGLYPSISRVIGDWIPSRERDTAQGLVWTFSRFGGSLAPWLLAAAAYLLGGWPAALWALAALGLVWVAAVWPWFRNRPEGVAASSGTRADVPWTVMLRSANAWALCAMYGFVGFAANFYVTFLRIYLKDYRRLSEEEIKWLTSLPLLCGVVACVLGGVLSKWLIQGTGSRKWGRRIGAMTGQFLAGLCLLLTIWAEDVWVFGTLLCLAFFFNDLAMGPAWAACVDIGEQHAGTLGGKMNMVGNIAGAFGIVLMGLLLEAKQPTALFVIFACSYGCAVLCWLFIDASKPLAAARFQDVGQDSHPDRSSPGSARES